MTSEQYIDPVLPNVEGPDNAEDTSFVTEIDKPHPIRGVVGRGLTALKATAVTVELLPVTNEGLRYSAFAYSQTLTHNPVVGAAVLGLGTFMVEAAGVLGSANWIAKDHIKDIIDGIDDKLANTKLSFLSPKKHIPENLHVSPLVEAGVAMTLGSVVMLEVKQRENPERTTKQNIKRGLGSAAALGAVFATQGALLAEGIENYNNPAVVGGVLFGLGAIVAAGRWIKKRANLGNNKTEKE